MNMAISSPSEYAMEMIVVMRMMFKTSNMRKPRRNRPIFFGIEVDAMKAKKVANMAKAMKEYIPEHARSIANDVGCPADVVSMIVGGPYDEDNVTGKLKAFSRAYEACVLKLAIAPPIVYKNSEGNGVKNRRNRIGKISTNNTFKLNNISVIPNVKIGRDKR